MKNLITIIIFISLLASCQSNSEKINQDTENGKLKIKYSGDADVVQFKMFEGLIQNLKKDSITGIFEGILEIPSLSEAIFTYDILVRKTDSLGQMIEIKPNSNLIKLNQNEAIVRGNRFLWIGKNRIVSYLENEELTGSLITKTVQSEFLDKEREITIYTPDKVNSKMPHIYFTDGSVVNSYAPYVDHLISTNKIIPVKLIGIHSSSSNRYEEYVKGDKDNDQFTKHQKFFYEEVVNKIDQEIENWEGRRYLFGFSNGAAFCMHEGINNPNEFEEIIVFSTADYISPIAQRLNPIKFKFDEYPKFYMGAGRYETSIFNDNLKFVKQMNENKLQVEFKEFISGHDYNVWRIEFLNYLNQRFEK